jgi:hypothetical protein
MRLPSRYRRLRQLLALVLCLTGAFLAAGLLAQTPTAPVTKRAAWPTVDQQVTQEYMGRKVQAGSALEALIRKHQDFSILREDEKTDNRGLPPWIRVWWRKAHPEVKYSAEDATGGYPRALHEILEWMMTHQDLKAGPGDQTKASVQPDAATIGSNVRTSGAQSSARSESDIRINYFDPTKILSASNNIAASGKQGIYYSIDGGTTWSQTTLPATGTDTSHSDPTVDWTSDSTGWSSTLGIQGSTLRLRNYTSANNGATWALDATPSGTQTNVDKQMVWVDHSASSPFQNRMYAIWHNGLPAFMNRRTANPGGAWLAAPLQVSGAETIGTAIGGDVKTNSAGDVFGAWPDSGTGSKIWMVKSTNGGDSFGAPVQVAPTFDTYDIGVPAMSSRRALIYVTLGTYRNGATNDVYAVWTDLSGATGCTAPANEPNTTVSSSCKTRIWFARSTNGGTTWGAPVKLNDQASLNDQFNQWLAVDETNGNIAVMYYDTVADAGRKKTDVWYQSSLDHGASWGAPQKVTTGVTDETIAGADSGNQYGDYNGLSGYNAIFRPSWTDRRSLASEEVWTSKIIDAGVPSPLLVANGSTITAGNCGNPTTAGMETGETVTVNFCVRNDGNLATTNVVGTLQATGGVTNPTPAQNYGAIASGGGSVCRSFTFNVGTACGGTLTATLQLQDGATNLGNVTYTFTVGTALTAFTEKFDGVTAPALPANWAAANASGAAPLWVTSATSPDTVPNDAFVDDPATVSDKRLDSAPIAITTSTAKVTFRHNYITEFSGANFYDGGVLEISSPNINAGVFTDIVTAGGSFASGGYVGTISSSFSNPLAGRQAWSGTSGGYITTVANLPAAAAGQTIKLRFRMGTDSSTSGTGWRVDGIIVQDGYSCPCAPVPLSVVSKKIHNGVAYDVNLPLSGTPGVEPRNTTNGAHQIVLTFANPVSITGASVTSGSGSVVNATPSGNGLIVNLTGVGNQQTTVVTITGINDGASAGDLQVPMSALVGDTNNDGSVDAGDIAQTKSQSGNAISSANCREDVNVDGFIDAGDISFVKSRSGTGL